MKEEALVVAREKSVADLQSRQYTESQHREFYRLGFNNGWQEHAKRADDTAYSWKRKCYLLIGQFKSVHNPALCEKEDCLSCDYICEIIGELGEWLPDEDMME